MISVMLLGSEAGPEIETRGCYLTDVFGWVGLLAGTVLVMRVMLEVLRPQIQAPPPR